jgi:hypothetical protein
MNSFDEWHLVSLAPWGQVANVVAIAIALTIIALAWRALAREERAWRRWVLLALRLGAVLAALVLFFEPAVQMQNVTRLPNQIAVLVDSSESMRLSERAGEPSRAERAARWLSSATPAFERLRQQHKLDFYSFGRDLQPSSQAALIAAPAPHADATRLREALSTLRAASAPPPTPARRKR